MTPSASIHAANARDAIKPALAKGAPLIITGCLGREAADLALSALGEMGSARVERVNLDELTSEAGGGARIQGALDAAESGSGAVLLESARELDARYLAGLLGSMRRVCAAGGHAALVIRSGVSGATLGDATLLGWDRLGLKA